jgi:sulfur carrier protein ThiS adenylyltransferase
VNLADRDLRQRDIVPPAQLAMCHPLIIGIGAVGHAVALQLAAMGAPRMTLVDDDVVDVVNLATQAYAPDQLGQPKVEAAAAECRRLNPDVKVQMCAEKFRRSSVRSLDCFEGSEERIVVFCCVDSITARSIVWESVRQKASFFVDARMSAEVVRILASDRPAQDEHYPSTLFRQEEAFTGACTFRSTIYCASIAAALMISMFTRWLRQMPVDPDVLLNLLSIELSVN